MTSSQHTAAGGVNERINETDGVLKDVTNAALFSGRFFIKNICSSASLKNFVFFVKF